MAKLSSSLVLNKYILNLFGVTDLEALSKDLKDSSLEGYDENNVSRFHHELVVRFYSNANLPKELLLQYDQNIYSHTQAISEKRDEPIKWKYFQYLALLFTEIYLDKYFTDKVALQAGLNTFLATNHGINKNDFSDVKEFVLDQNINDLNKLAYWNATGSGKTLLMHINILQYRHYLKLHNIENSLNRIIVLTPNEGLSKQHLKEFTQSGLEAEMFDRNGGGIFSGQKIEIIEISKLREKSGPDTVALESFENNNLLLVDEGHKGIKESTSKLPWKKIRSSLAEIGFTFEYSATFGQAVEAETGVQRKDVIDEYSKATIFDYSYPYFYNDGYGKDYQILNLNQQWREAGREESVVLYLTASLLSFYEQLLVFRENRNDIEPFLIEKPLAIFVGGKVTKSISKETASDVVEVLKFIEAFVKNEKKSIERINLLITGKDGLNNTLNQPIFKNSFNEIRKTGKTAEMVFQDVLFEIFNTTVAGASLHLHNLKGQDGEIALRIGSSEDAFGVINVGDDKGLLKICEENKLIVEDRDFADSLFHDINSKTSKINILIGSKKFTEGWSSWRVSTMGLLNIGRDVGSEIIQLFGRGVRLKGYKFSLKRSTKLDPSLKPSYIPDVLPILETLNIFGLRAKYMEEFQDILEKEGLPSGKETAADWEKINIDVLPTIFNLSGNKLKFIRIRGDVNFKKDVPVDAILNPNAPKVFLDWYPKVQILKSAKTTNISKIENVEEGKLSPENLAFLDWNRIYFEIQKFKNERSWYNLNLSIEELKAIMHDQNWYFLQIPLKELELNDYVKVKLWHELSVSLLKSFIERLYNFEKSKFFSDKYETFTLDKTHPNFIEEYNFLIKKSETILINKLNELKEIVAKKEFKENFQIDKDFEALYSAMHLYEPLIYIDEKNFRESVKIQPVVLNKGERDLVEDLKIYFEANKKFFNDKQLYLLRNKSKTGVGFFEANNFFPDFILWLVIGKKQYVSFIDPKGITHIKGLADPKIQLHKRIKVTIQPKLNDPDIELNSFIISNTSFEQVKHWRDQDCIEDFNSNHVLFQVEQKNTYIQIIIDRAQK